MSRRVNACPAPPYILFPVTVRPSVCESVISLDPHDGLFEWYAPLWRSVLFDTVPAFDTSMSMPGPLLSSTSLPLMV